jgi:hypothetical protein
VLKRNGVRISDNNMKIHRTNSVNNTIQTCLSIPNYNSIAEYLQN